MEIHEELLVSIPWADLAVISRRALHGLHVEFSIVLQRDWHPLDFGLRHGAKHSAPSFGLMP